MRKHWQTSVIAVAILVFTGACAQSQPPQVVAGGPPANVAGTWTGSVGAGSQSTSATLNLEQQGNAVTGTVDVGGRADLSGDIKGTVNGNVLTYRLASGYSSNVDMTVSGDQMRGVIGGAQAQLRKSR